VAAGGPAWAFLLSLGVIEQASACSDIHRHQDIRGACNIYDLARQVGNAGKHNFANIRLADTCVRYKQGFHPCNDAQESASLAVLPSRVAGPPHPTQTRLIEWAALAAERCSLLGLRSKTSEAQMSSLDDLAEASHRQLLKACRRKAAEHPAMSLGPDTRSHYLRHYLRHYPERRFTGQALPPPGAPFLSFATPEVRHRLRSPSRA
jgi:hypothetical protein